MCLFFKLFQKMYNKKNTKEYEEDIRQFAITLHYFSPRAYNYVRNILKGALPHCKTLSKWYKTINTAQILKERNKHQKRNHSLVLDEMSLR